MGGAGYIFIGSNDADILHNSATINLDVLEAARRRSVGRIFYSSSACMYPGHNQADADNPNCAEDNAYPEALDSEYGWEELFSDACITFISATAAAQSAASFGLGCDGFLAGYPR